MKSREKMDEMERSILLRSQGYAYKFVVLFLCGWTIYESYRGLTLSKPFNIIPSLVVTLTMMVQLVSQLLIKKRMVEGDAEYKEPNRLLQIFLFVMAASVLTAFLVSYFVLVR